MNQALAATALLRLRIPSSESASVTPASLSPTSAAPSPGDSSASLTNNTLLTLALAKVQWVGD